MTWEVLSILVGEASNIVQSMENKHADVSIRPAHKDIWRLVSFGGFPPWEILGICYVDHSCSLVTIFERNSLINIIYNSISNDYWWLIQWNVLFWTWQKITGLSWKYLCWVCHALNVCWLLYPDWLLCFCYFFFLSLWPIPSLILRELTILGLRWMGNRLIIRVHKELHYFLLQIWWLVQQV